LSIPLERVTIPGMDMARYGRAIARRRTEMGVTQGEMARRFGVAQNTLSRIETGVTRETPHPEFLNAVERELGMTITEQLSLVGYRLVSDSGNPFEPGTLKWRVVERMKREELELYRIQGLALILDLNPDEETEVG
jgi:transcriptional regulator with XRE-family HTH domain